MTTLESILKTTHNLLLTLLRETPNGPEQDKIKYLIDLLEEEISKL